MWQSTITTSWQAQHKLWIWDVHQPHHTGQVSGLLGGKFMVKNLIQLGLRWAGEFYTEFSREESVSCSLENSVISVILSANNYKHIHTQWQCHLLGRHALPLPHLCWNPSWTATCVKCRSCWTVCLPSFQLLTQLCLHRTYTGNWFWHHSSRSICPDSPGKWPQYSDAFFTQATHISWDT
jgi:hypothetical protein